MDITIEGYHHFKEVNWMGIPMGWEQSANGKISISSSSNPIEGEGQRGGTSAFLINGFWERDKERGVWNWDLPIYQSETLFSSGTDTAMTGRDFRSRVGDHYRSGVKRVFQSIVFFFKLGAMVSKWLQAISPPSSGHKLMTYKIWFKTPVQQVASLVS